MKLGEKNTAMIIAKENRSYAILCLRGVHHKISALKHFLQLGRNQVSS